MRRTRGSAGHAFTLVELLVVIAIIALLLAILLPSLAGARRQGQAVKCGVNLHHVSQACTMYLGENRGIYPPSYIYALDGDGNYDLENQDQSHPHGYIHWSYFLYNRGQADEKAFQCPSYPNGGAPRTNPGHGDWEPGQQDQNGQSVSNNLEDKQAPRMAYTANAAIISRNKYTNALSGGPRVNVPVAEKNVQPGAVLVTEFNNNWRSIAINRGNMLSKSHRPITPFIHIGTGTNDYGSLAPGFTYGTAPSFDVLPFAEIDGKEDLIGPDDDGTGGSYAVINAVGRHHPGNDGFSGGSANFLYVDGHVEKKTVLQTITNNEWGNRYWSVNGSNKVGPPWN